jgi:crossover junction endodeoxyribonuclease RuvC
MLTLGIDPGISGAVGALNADGSFHCCFTLPAIRDKSLSWIDGQQLTSQLLQAMDGQPARVVIERVASRPGQGVASCFGFGVTYGSILAAIQVLRLPLTFVTPAVWKRDLSLGKDKNAARHKAQLLWPTADLSLVKHHNLAESLLLAHWGLTYQRKAAA